MAGFLKGSRKSVSDAAKIARAAEKRLQQVQAGTLSGGKTVTNLAAKIEEIRINTNRYLSKYIEQYMLIRDEETAIQYFDKIIENGIAAIDTETTGLNTMHCKIAGLCLYTPGMKPCYIPMNHIGHISQQRLGNQMNEEFIAEQLRRCENAGIKWIFHNAKFDIRVIKHTCGVVIHPYWDTMIAAKLLNENESAALKNLHLKYCDSQDQIALTISNLFDGLTFTLIPIDCAYLYAAGDAIKTFELFEFQKRHLESDKLKRVYKVFTDIEMPLIMVLVDMEDQGVFFDKQYADELSAKYNTLLQEAEKACYDCLAKEANKIDMYKRMTPNHKLSNPISLSSPVQIAIIIYDILKLKPTGHKDYGRKTGEEVLSLIDHPFPKLLLKYREISKLISTYVDKLPAVVDPDDGRIHCSFNQVRAVTGRMSSSDPNLQNIPSHNKEIRKMFIAAPGNYLVSGDFSQQEPKALAHMSGDENFIRAYAEGRDIYAWCASMVYNIPYDQCMEFYLDENGKKTDKVNPEGKKRRTEMKSVILGLMYGRGPQTIAEQLSVSVKRAQEIIEAFYTSFPRVKDYVEMVQHKAATEGFVETAYGRKRRLPDMMLPEFQFKITDPTKLVKFNPLDFNTQVKLPTTVPQDKVDYYWNKMSKAYGWAQKQRVRDEAAQDGIEIIDNGGKIADASRQCCNSTIQGTAADITKTAMIAVANDPILKELGFKMAIQIHDELIGECPKENSLKAADRLAEVMINSCADTISVKMAVDTEIVTAWYGGDLKDDLIAAQTAC